MISPSAEQQIRQQAKRLGVLAERVIRHGRKAMTWTEHDEIVLTLRDGEKVLLTLLASLSQELERIKAAADERAEANERYRLARESEFQSLQQELERIRTENQELQARVDSLRLHATKPSQREGLTQ